jgi:hypothetical protein
VGRYVFRPTLFSKTERFRCTAQADDILVNVLFRNCFTGEDMVIYPDF